jgi:hypothetical protein
MSGAPCARGMTIASGCFFNSDCEVRNYGTRSPAHNSYVYTVNIMLVN